MTKPTHPAEVARHLDSLKQEHKRLEERLRELEKHLSLTPDEQIERATIKKVKLQLKDDIVRWQHQLPQA
jgi:hypothetical protein